MKLLIGEFRNMVDVNFVCAMGPPGGGRNPVTPRLMRHFNYLAFTELEDPSKAKIFGTILNGWIRESLLSISCILNTLLLYVSVILIIVIMNIFNTCRVIRKCESKAL